MRKPKQSFSLSFDEDKIKYYSARYSYPDNGIPIEKIQSDVEKFGMSYKSAANVISWKTRGRSSHHFLKNSEERFKIIIGRVSHHESAESNISNLKCLHGVGAPVASTILSVMFPQEYTILDFRALHALGIPKKLYYSNSFFPEYNAFCLQLAKKNGVDLRTLDKALWQWSKENSGH